MNVNVSGVGISGVKQTCLCEGQLKRRRFLGYSFAASAVALLNGALSSRALADSSGVLESTDPPRQNGQPPQAQPVHGAPQSRDYRFDGTISREVLDNYLSRAISLETLISASRGDFDDDLRMLQSIGAKYAGRSFSVWGTESSLLQTLEWAKGQAAKVHTAQPEMILEACIYENVTTQVEEIAVPDWALTALGQPAEKRNFRYADIIYADGRHRNQWGKGASVPDVSRPETKLWFYFLAASYMDIGIEAIHFGQVELMGAKDQDLRHWAEVFALVRTYAAAHARRHMVLCNAHVPSGGLVRDGHLLLDFHAFPLRIMEIPDRPQEAVLKVDFADSIYGRSKGGITFSGWKCKHLPYLVEFDNWGVSDRPGHAGEGGFWVWGYDEITWFGHQSKQYRDYWLRYAWNWVRRTDSNGYLEMPGGRIMTSPLDKRNRYYANMPSSAVPDGLGDEETIRAIWAADAS
jgi:hypothetical protein